MSTTTLPFTQVNDAALASIVYPAAGASQHLCLIRHGSSSRLPSPLTLEWSDLPKSVIGSAFTGRSTLVPTPLPAPHGWLRLPVLSKQSLQLQLIKDDEGKELGWLARIPALYTHANQILSNHLSGNKNYDYAFSISRMCVEAATMAASVIERGILTVRERPGLMGHALELPELAPDELGISVEFAARLMKSLETQANIKLDHAWQLDGFPVYAVRFPIANRHGVAEMTLRVLPGKGRYLACNPWTLGKRFLGDRDGDLLFALLRVDKWWRGEVEDRPRLKINSEIDQVMNSLTLSSVLDPNFIGKGKPVHLDSRENRLRWIEDADSRGFVAIFTMMSWWIARTLMMNGETPKQAYEKASDCLEWLMEASMDGRKDGSPFSHPSFDVHEFMDSLMRGANEFRDIDFPMLREIGMPDGAIETLKLAWLLSNRNLRTHCAKSPVFDATVLRRNDTNAAVADLLIEMQKQGVQPADVYSTIIRDLQGDEMVFTETPITRVISPATGASHGNQWIGRR